MSDGKKRKPPRRKRDPIPVDRDRIREEAFRAIRALRERPGPEAEAGRGQTAPRPAAETGPVKAAPRPAADPAAPERSPYPAPPRRRRGRALVWSLAVNAGLILMIIVATRLPGRLAPIAVLTVSDRIVSVSETNGTEKWRHEFPARVSHAGIAPWTKAARYVVVAYWDTGFGPGRLALYDIRKDREVWSRTVDVEPLVEMYGEDLTRPGDMWSPVFTFADLEGDGEPEIAATFHHQHWLPACVRTYDRDGAELGTYYHWGYFNAIGAHDLDGDGRQEIVAAGTNNAHDVQGATVVVLDRDHLSGYSADPAIPRFAMHAEGARIRVVLPQWDPEIMRLVPVKRLTFGGLTFFGEGADTVILARVTVEGGVAVRFDADLHPLGAIPPDHLTEAGARWLREGRTTVDISAGSFWTDWLSRAMRFEAPGPAS